MRNASLSLDQAADGDEDEVAAVRPRAHLTCQRTLREVRVKQIPVDAGRDFSTPIPNSERNSDRVAVGEHGGARVLANAARCPD
jgi:hypothetical protein